MPVFSLPFPWEAGITVELSEIEQVGDSNVFGEYRGDHHYLSDEDLLDTDCPAAGKCIGLLTRVSFPSFVFQRGCPPPSSTPLSIPKCLRYQDGLWGNVFGLVSELSGRGMHSVIRVHGNRMFHYFAAVGVCNIG